MTPEQIQLLQRSYSTIRPISADVGRSFYGKLFELAPETRPLFENNVTEHWRIFMSVFEKMLRMELRSMLTLPVTRSGNREVSIPGVTEIAEHYAASGVRAEHFAAGRQALMWALAAHVGNDLDEDTAEAWAQAYDMVADAMMSVINSEAVEPSLPEAHGRSAPANGEASLELLFSQ
ncbi:MAG: globin domain-containing protein [Rhodomicrobiaceae bacterium]